jgi:hypothetical protein
LLLDTRKGVGLRPISNPLPATQEKTDAQKGTNQFTSTLPTVGKLKEGRARKKSPQQKYTLSRNQILQLIGKPVVWTAKKQAAV